MRGRVATWTVLVIVLFATSAAAQGKPSTPAPDAHYLAQQAGQPGPGAPAPGGGAMMGAMPMMEMCRMMHMGGGMMGGATGGGMGGGMMGGGMAGGMPMMGMMGGMRGAAESPQIMQMRGEMLKAMGEIMLKYGKMMEGASK